MENKTETYQCICRKCNQSFTSKNELDTDGDGFCDKCIVVTRDIAHKVDEIMKQRKMEGKGLVKPPSINLPVYFEAGN